MDYMLNEDVLRTIFSYLNINEKMEMMRVCNQWRSVIQKMVVRLSIDCECWSARFCDNEKHHNLCKNEILRIVKDEAKPFDLTATFPKLKVLWIILDDKIVQDVNVPGPKLYEGIVQINKWFEVMSPSSNLTCIHINLADDETLKLISMKCKSKLCHFKVEKGSQHLRSESLSTFISTCDKLEVLEFHNYSFLNPDILKDMNNLSKLKVNRIKEDIAQSSRFNEELMTLKLLILDKKEEDSLHSNDKLSEVKELIKTEKNIQSPNKITSLELVGGRICLRAISLLFQNLTYLNITLDFDGIRSSIKYTPGLPHLNELELFFLPAEDIEMINECVIPIFQYCPLKKLTIDKVDGKTCDFITKYWTKLEHLKIDCGMDLVDHSILDFHKLIELRTFTLSYAQNITDDSLSMLIKNCSHLYQLSLFYMINITESILNLMIKKAKSFPERDFFCDFYDTSVAYREYNPPENLFIDIYNQREHSLIGSDLDFGEYMAQFEDDFYDEFNDYDEEDNFDEDEDYNI